MKKMVICALVGVIGFAGAKFYLNNQKIDVEQLFLENVEALTQTEGTAVNTCYYENYYEMYPDTWQLKCPSETTSGMIYPCPPSESRFVAATFSMCTK